MIEDYFGAIDALVASTAIVHSSVITHDKRSAYVGLIRGELRFLDGSVLHLREFVNIQHGLERYVYAYHYQRADGTLVFRYDNAPHHANLSTRPHHKHVGTETHVVPTREPDLGTILAEIRELLAPILSS